MEQIFSKLVNLLCLNQVAQSLALQLLELAILSYSLKLNAFLMQPTLYLFLTHTV